MELQYRRPDGSYLAEVNGLPYHIIEGDPLFAEAQTNGADLPLEPVPEPAAITVDDFRVAIQALVDQTAQARSYDSGITCASYVGSTNPIWAAEAAAFVARCGLGLRLHRTGEGRGRTARAAVSFGDHRRASGDGLARLIRTKARQLSIQGRPAMRSAPAQSPPTIRIPSLDPVVI